MATNILRVLGVENREDCVSNLLAHLVNASPEFGRNVARLFFGDEGMSSDVVRAYTRTSVAGAGVPDICLKVLADGFCRLCVIENKLRAEEGKDQRVRYAQPETARAIERALHDQYPIGDYGPDGDHGKITLSLFDDYTSGDYGFGAITYRQLLPILEGSDLGQDRRLDLLRSDLVEILKVFYESVCMDGSRSAAECLLLGRELDANYQSFLWLMEHVSSRTGVPLAHSRRASWRGRKTFFSVLAKPSWTYRGKESAKLRRLHFEPTLNCLSADLCISVLVHQELDDYTPKAQVGDRDLVDALKRDNHDLGEYLRRRVPEGIHVRVGWNGVAKKEVWFDKGTSMAELADRIAVTLDDLTPLLDEYCTLSTTG